jgi:hypothetical protein
MTTWNKITKASGTSWTKIAEASARISTGSPIGLLLALTYTNPSGGWNKVTKATSTSWTKITKAT